MTKLLTAILDLVHPVCRSVRPSRRPRARPARHLVVTGVVVIISAALAGCSLPRSHQAAPRPPAATAAPADPDALLPLTSAQLTAAVGLAVQFAGAYTTSRYNEPADTYLARLRPLTDPALYAALARAAGTPGLRKEHAQARATTTGYATAEQIRLLAADQVIVIVSATQDTATTAGSAENSTALAVTVVPAGGGWLAHDVEPATAGDQGGPSDAGP